MYHEIKKFFLGGISLTIVNISQKAVNFLLLPIFTYYLSPKDFGYIGVYFLVISVLAMFYNPGVISSATRLFYDNEIDSLENKKIIGSTMIFLIVIPIIVLLISLFVGQTVFNLVLKEVSFWPYGLLAIIGAIMTQPIRMWSSYFIILGRSKDIAIWSFVQMLISVIFSLLFVVYFDLGGIGRIYGLLIGNSFLFLLSSYFTFKLVGFNFSFVKIKEILTAGFPLIFSVFAYVILDVSDRYMITEFLGLEFLGKYDISYTIASIPLFIVVGFNQVWQPTFFEKMKEKNYELISKMFNYFIYGFTLITILVMIFSNEIFNLFINSKYISGITVVPWVLIGVFFLGLTSFLNTILMFDKKFKQSGFFSIIAAFINIILNIFLIPYLGIVGAAISTFLAYFIYFIALIFLTRKKVYSLFDFKKLSIPFIYLIIVTGIMCYINYNYFTFNFSFICIKILFVISSIIVSTKVIFKNESFKIKSLIISKIRK
jgi:O-antigen/teichoic acid export membrane protein